MLKEHREEKVILNRGVGESLAENFTYDRTLGGSEGMSQADT